MDVCPLVPVSGITMEETVAHAHRLARRLVATRHGSAWYVAFTRLDPEQRKGIREEYAEIKKILKKETP